MTEPECILYCREYDRASVKIAQGNQHKPVMALFIVIHGAAGALESFIVVVVQQNHASGRKPRTEVLKSGKQGSVEIRVQAYQGVSLFL